MAGYNSTPKDNTGAGESYYKVLVSLKHKDISDKGKTLHLSGGLQAKTVVFLDTRKLWEWMFKPFYNIKNSVTGQVDV